jgi:hypothetical protein
MQSQRITSIALWTLQILLGLFIALASGLPKFFLPPEALNMPIPLPDWFVKFIGTCEILGGLALILPRFAKTPLWLAPLAAVCLVALAVCATIYQLMAGQPGSAVFAAVLAVLFALVGYARWRVSRGAAVSTTLLQASVPAALHG